MFFDYVWCIVSPKLNLIWSSTYMDRAHSNGFRDSLMFSVLFCKKIFFCGPLAGRDLIIILTTNCGPCSTKCKYSFVCFFYLFFGDSCLVYGILIFDIFAVYHFWASNMFYLTRFLSYLIFKYWNEKTTKGYKFGGEVCTNRFSNLCGKNYLKKVQPFLK